MKMRFLPAIFLAVAFIAAAGSQDSGSIPPAGQSAGQDSGGSYGQRGGRGGFGGGMGMMGRGLMGTVTEAAANHYTIKTDAGEVYTVHFTADTRIMKQAAGMHRGGGQGEGEGGGQGQSGGMGRGYGGGGGPQQISASDIKVGDSISVMGDIDATAKSASAMRIVLLDPAVVEQMRAMEANFGKTWLQGKVTAIDGTKITLSGALDNAPHTVVADENTTFRKRREPVTLADIQIGDTIRVEGAVKNGVFTASSVNVAGMMGGETPTVPRSSPPQ